MPLHISYIERIEDVVDPAVAFLSMDRDLFARPRIVVPNAGTRAWLSAELATKLGARGAADGIVAHVDVCYPNALVRMLDADDTRETDPWTLDRLTFVILSIIVGDASFRSLTERHGGPLLAARAMAERFDDYHVRRPGMIRNWADGAATLSPTAEQPQPPVRNDAAVQQQFRLWRAVHAAIGADDVPPPCRELVPMAADDGDVFVAGLQHLSERQIAVLHALASQRTVQVYLAHPSPRLHALWATSAPGVSPKLVPQRQDHRREQGVDPLVSAWLAGSRETQWLLASQGVMTTPVGRPEPVASASLLHRMQRTVTVDLEAGREAFDPADTSLRIHRCHGLSRQAEVLRDAILHAFRELPDLRPHEVAIVSPCIADAAPHLEAAFARKIPGEGGDMQLPLVVADRGIRDLSPGAELLGHLLANIRSRYSIDGVLDVATHPLVLAHFAVADDIRDDWKRCLERTKIRWGLDARQRQQAGLDAPGLDVHTWRLGLEQMLLGVTLPDAEPRPELGGVLPLDDLDPSALDAIATLIRIVGILADLETATHAAAGRPVAEWCETVETALAGLCGAACQGLGEPRRELDALRRAANDVAVPFHDFKVLLADALDAISGRQPLRTGAITATSMVPLRGVPFRVVCVIGYDERAVAPGDSRGDDLVAEQSLLGDIDPRLEVRRSLLDCLLAARDRLIIACTGMNVANNEKLPLVTPLAELVDFARRHGVPDVDREGEAFSALETFHPRHAVGRGNFVRASLHPTEAWSHDVSARHVAERLGQPLDHVETPAATTPVRLVTVPLERLAEMLHDPLLPYVRRTLEINTWRDDEAQPPPTLPLALSGWEQRAVSEKLLETLAAGEVSDERARALVEAMQASGRLPFGSFGESLGEEIRTVVTAIVAKAVELNTPLNAGTARDVALTVGRFTIAGTLTRVYGPGHAGGADGKLLLVSTDGLGSAEFQKPKLTAALHLLAAIAGGFGVRTALVLSRHKEWKPGAAGSITQVRTITAAPEIDAEEALRRLEKLCELLEIASASPCGRFDDAADKALADATGAAGRKAFDTFLHDPREYPKSKERVVYGTAPDYGDVFSPDSTERTFHEASAGLVEVTCVRNRPPTYSLT